MRTLSLSLLLVCFGCSHAENSVADPWQEVGVPIGNVAFVDVPPHSTVECEGDPPAICSVAGVRLSYDRETAVETLAEFRAAHPALTVVSTDSNDAGYWLVSRDDDGLAFFGRFNHGFIKCEASGLDDVADVTRICASYTWQSVH